MSSPLACGCQLNLAVRTKGIEADRTLWSVHIDPLLPLQLIAALFDQQLCHLLAIAPRLERGHLDSGNSDLELFDIKAELVQSLREVQGPMICTSAIC